MSIDLFYSALKGYRDTKCDLRYLIANGYLSLGVAENGIVNNKIGENGWYSYNVLRKVHWGGCVREPGGHNPYIRSRHFIHTI